ncbi:MAG: metalloregulator ArsR/SmtB family transcription factor [Micrococcales bacterium]|nr:metalloregulator ArsR/SmtB family transcription factor [Micrococcales bacterium]
MTIDSLTPCGPAEPSSGCPPVNSVKPDQAARQHLAGIFKALADPARLHLLALIAASPGQEACICHLTGPVGLAQPTVSHHMRLLAEAGLVTRQQRGKWAFFGIVPKALENLAQAVASLGLTEGADAQLEG